MIGECAESNQGAADSLPLECKRLSLGAAIREFNRSLVLQGWKIVCF